MIAALGMAARKVLFFPERCINSAQRLPSSSFHFFRSQTAAIVCYARQG